MIVKANMINGLKSYSGKIRFEENDFEFIKDAANVNLLTGKICYKDIWSVLGFPGRRKLVSFQKV